MNLYRSVPSYFIWLKYLSWFNYANELLTVNQWDGITSISCPEGSLRCYRNGDDVINYLNMSKVFFSTYLVTKLFGKLIFL